jgi:Type II secretion system (T2SS), protein G
MRRQFLVWAPIFLLAVVSCDSGEPQQPNLGDRAAARINETAMDVYFVNIRSAAQKYRAARGAYPETMDDLVAEGLIRATSATDPWGNPWVLDTSGGELVITSYGSDGAPGGVDAARDRISR